MINQIVAIDFSVITVNFLAGLQLIYGRNSVHLQYIYTSIYIIQLNSEHVFIARGNI